MALILEIRGARGVTTWHRLDTLPLTLGRALSNDVIVDDPYVDARHARIVAVEGGAVAIEDLGSVNALHANGARVEGTLPLQAGAELRMGRTVLRFRDSDELLPPALVEAPQASRYAMGLATTRGRLGVVVLALVAVALKTWLGNTEQSSGTSVFGAILAAVAVVIVWAAIWAVAARGADRRFHLVGHVAVISLALLAMVAYGVVNEWLTFLFPDASVVSWAYSAVFLAVLAAVVAEHLSVANVLTARSRWRAGFIVSGTVLALIVAAAVVGEEKFTDVPAFPGQLKHMPASLVPTKTVDQFLGAMREAKQEADEAIAK